MIFKRENKTSATTYCLRFHIRFKSFTHTRTHKPRTSQVFATHTVRKEKCLQTPWSLVSGCIFFVGSAWHPHSGRRSGNYTKKQQSALVAQNSRRKLKEPVKKLKSCVWTWCKKVRTFFLREKTEMNQNFKTRKAVKDCNRAVLTSFLER